MWSWLMMRWRWYVYSIFIRLINSNQFTYLIRLFLGLTAANTDSLTKCSHAAAAQRPRDFNDKFRLNLLFFLRAQPPNSSFGKALQFQAHDSRPISPGCQALVSGRKLSPVRCSSRGPIRINCCFKS